MNGTLLDSNMCILGPKRPFGGPKTDKYQQGPLKGPQLEKYWFLGWKNCAEVPFVITYISTMYPTMKRTLLDPMVCLLEPTGPFEGPKSCFFWPTSVQKRPFSDWNEPNCCFSIIIFCPTKVLTLLNPNITLLMPTGSFKGPKYDEMLICGPKKVRRSFLCNYRKPNCSLFKY